MARLSKRQRIPIVTKREICQHFVHNPHLRHEDLAWWCFTRFGIRPDRNTIGKIQRGEKKWRAATKVHGRTFRLRQPMFPQLERQLSNWVRRAYEAGDPLTLRRIQEKARSLCRELNIDRQFLCLLTWVHRMMHRMGFHNLTRAGEAAAADMNAVTQARLWLPELILHLCVSPKDLMNLDETALFPACQQRKTWATEATAGVKTAKDCLTFAFICNVDGSETFRPMVISKVRRPRDFTDNRFDKRGESGKFSGLVPSSICLCLFKTLALQQIRAWIVRRGSTGGGGYGPASAGVASPGGTAGAGGVGGFVGGAGGAAGAGGTAGGAGGAAGAGGTARRAGGAAGAGGTRGAAGAGGAGATSPGGATGAGGAGAASPGGPASAGGAGDSSTEGALGCSC
ncbi:unnamed protein product [Closterium sp. NIES-54]